MNYEVYTDGASRGNPGHASCAYVIISMGRVIEEKAEYLGVSTNNQAEYMGIIRAMEKLVEIKGFDVVIYSDSELIVRQLNKEYKVKHPELKKYFQTVTQMIPLVFPVRFEHVLRSENKRADMLCNQVLNQIQLLR